MNVKFRNDLSNMIVNDNNWHIVQAVELSQLIKNERKKDWNTPFVNHNRKLVSGDPVA